ncbi:MAG: M1 family aminopeptidase [bacterium]
MRIARFLLSLGFVLVGAAAVACAFALLLAVQGHNLPLLRSAVGLVGRAMAGQRTEALTLRVQLSPAARHLSGEARLTVRADGEGRRRLYFLLNDGLRLRSVWREAADGGRGGLPFLRFGPLAIVDLGDALAANAAVDVGFAYDGTPQRSGPSTGGGLVFDADDVVLTPADLWYPADVQGAFSISAEVLLPADLTLVHNGHETARTIEGNSTRVRFASERPVAGLALVAGRYTVHELERDGRRYRTLLAADTTLDAPRLAAEMATAYQGLTTHFAASGFPQSTLVVARRQTRAFNDGSGLIVVPPRYLRDGRYGFETIAHELAHDWWGATVSERWLTPGSGGEWMVEGFAQHAAWRAVAEHFGTPALVRTLARNAFDPDTTGVLADMSVVDNGFDPNARATIYAKGGYVAYLLAQQLGGEGFDAAARAFVDQYRYRAAGDAELEAVFATVSQQDLKPFFATWVRSKAGLDLALEPQDGNVTVRSLRAAAPPAALALWRFRADGAAEPAQIGLGESAPLDGAKRAIVDPLAATADMIRSNNVLPRQDAPQRVAASARGELLVVEGEPVGWEAATLRVVEAASGKAIHTWIVDRGLNGEPVWSADGTRVLAVESARSGEPSLVALSVADGGRQELGHDAIAAGDANGTIVARDGKLIRLAKAGNRVLVNHPGARVFAPRPAPQGGAIAYALLRDADMELRVLPAGAPDSRVIFTWPASGLRWSWSPDATHLYAVIGGEWDWQLWELSLDGSAPRRLVHEAARIADLAVAADGKRVALVAQADLDEPNDRADIFVIDGDDFRRFELPGRSALSAAWLDADALVVVTADASDVALPRATALQRLQLSDGSLTPF